MATSRGSRERLIDEVRRYPVLYDTKHEQHRDIDVRDRCWVEIADRLGSNSEVLKREWKILRDSLRQALKKTKGGATTKAGQPVKRWRFFSRMAFLLPHMTLRGRRQREILRNEVNIKLDLEAPAEADEPATDPGAGGEEWLEDETLASVSARASAGGGGVAGGGADDALELFFASVCAGARQLPPPQRRALKRAVLDALHRCEEDAAAPLAPAPRIALPRLYVKPDAALQQPESSNRDDEC